MNQHFLEEKLKRELLISIGFVLEVCLFMLAGFFAAYLNLFAFGWFGLGLIVAFVVGDKIAKNSLLNYKLGL